MSSDASPLARDSTAPTVLVVEDNPDTRLLIQMALEDAGYRGQPLTARDGVEALEVLLPDGPVAEDRELPALVLMDIDMPNVDGLEVLERVRGDPRTADLPVVILSNIEDAQLEQRGYALGANGWVRKPARYADLSDAVDQILAFWLPTARGSAGNNRTM